MSNITDELLNRYIDGELDSSEMKALKDDLENDDNALSRLRALQAVDNSLRHMEADPTPEFFTDKLMKALGAMKKADKPKVNYFFLTVVSIFAAGVLAVFVAAVRSAEKINEPSAITSYSGKVKDLFGKNLALLQNVFSNPSVVLIISIFSLILLLTAYFTYESHKNFTKKLNSISN